MHTELQLTHSTRQHRDGSSNCATYFLNEAELKLLSKKYALGCYVRVQVNIFNSI